MLRDFSSEMSAPFEISHNTQWVANTKKQGRGIIFFTAQEFA